MYSILAVEDEEIIRRALPLIIDWDAIGFHIVEALGSAVEALKFLESREVDLVLTDIRMPVINGLELACELKSRFPAVKTILLSAYRDFEYAVKGIEYGVYGYLLKSANKDETRSYFVKLKETLDREKLIAGKMDLPKGVSPDKLWLEYRCFLTSLLNWKEGTDRRSLVQDGLSVGIDLSKHQWFTAVVLELDGRRLLAGKIGEEALYVIDNRIRYYTSSAVEGNQNGYVIDMGNRLILILTISENNLHSFIQSLFDDLTDELSLEAQEYGHGTELTVTCAVGRHADTPECIKSSLQSALAVIRNKVYLGGGRLIFASESEDACLTCSTSTWLDDRLDQTEALLSAKKFNTLTELLSEIEKQLTDEKTCDMTGVYRYCRKLLEKASELYSQFISSGDEGSLNARELAESISETDTISAAMMPVKDLLFRLEGLYAGSEVRYDTNRIVEKALKYIYEHYDMDLYLDEVAGHVNVHPVYLCRLFRQGKNMGFKEILTNIRMEKAKALLSDIGYKVYEVSLAVGYSKPKYFSDLFKKVTGLTPLEYRDRCR